MNLVTEQTVYACVFRPLALLKKTVDDDTLLIYLALLRRKVRKQTAENIVCMNIAGIVN